jgi:hypothetical protein
MSNKITLTVRVLMVVSAALFLVTTTACTSSQIENGVRQGVQQLKQRVEHP